MNPLFCKGCGRPMRWYETTGGRWVPLDPDPDPAGNIRIDVVRNLVYTVAPGSHKPLYRDHRDTCEKPWKAPVTPRRTGG